MEVQNHASASILVLNNWTPSLFHEANWNIQVQTLKKLSVEHLNTHRRTDVCLVFAFLWALCFSLCCLCLLLNQGMLGWRNRMCLVSSCKEPIQTNLQTRCKRLTIYATRLNRHSESFPKKSQSNQLSQVQANKTSCWKLCNPMLKVKVMGGYGRGLNQTTPFNQQFTGDGFLYQANHHCSSVHGFLSYGTPRK